MNLLVVLLFLLSSATAGSEAYLIQLSDTLNSEANQDFVTIATCRKQCATLESKARNHTVYTEAVVSSVWAYVLGVLACSLIAAVVARMHLSQKEVEWLKEKKDLHKRSKGLQILAFNNAENLMKAVSEVEEKAAQLEAANLRECHLQLLLQQQAHTGQQCQERHQVHHRCQGIAVASRITNHDKSCTDNFCNVPCIQQKKPVQLVTCLTPSTLLSC
jgi:hypothetical protein